MSYIQSQLKLTGMKLELLTALAEVEAQESTQRKKGMFRTVDLAANVASSPRVCAQFSCLVGTCHVLTREAQLANPATESPALLAAMKAELKTALAEVEAQESTQ
ncbi:hypothetical protein [Brevibacillus halotolerans]|uniref:hypothetical protein n=1 Tax=Brevibacillus halotolerans TaxID=1507437 RepID=UPI0015EE8E5A|nr:hypothetical protein [Brevibacillus halotolerans]MBA4535185.1 hypothetical protein [Brevibacillus halotolerans]